MTQQDVPHTRRTDDDKDQETVARIQKARREGRGRTLLYSAIVAGIVAQFFGYTNDIDQVGRSRKNCHAIQLDRSDRSRTVYENAQRLQGSSDQVLGNKRLGIPPFKFKGTALEDFEAPSKVQARKDRAEAQLNYQRAKKITNRQEDCNAVFPKPKVIPFT